MTAPEDWQARALAAEAELAKARPVIEAAYRILDAARPVLLNLMRLEEANERG